MIFNWYERLRNYAKGLELDSINVGPAKLKYNQSITDVSSFKQLQQKLEKVSHSNIHDVFIVSAHNVDEVTLIDQILADHESEARFEPIRVPGGSGANSGFTMSSLGLNVGITGIVGNDNDGELINASLAGVGVDTQLMEVSEKANTGKATILVEKSGRRLNVVQPGINNHFADSIDVKKVLERGESSSVVHLSSFVGPRELKLQEKLACELSESSIISLAPGALYARMGLDRLNNLLEHVDIVFLYQEQLESMIRNSSAKVFLNGRAIPDYLEALYQWRKKLAHKSPLIVVVKSPPGSDHDHTAQKWLTVGTGFDSLEFTISPQDLPRNFDLSSIDTTGAGDAAVAGFVLSFLGQGSLEACIDTAFLMSSFASTQVGARSAFLENASIPELEN